MVSESPECRAKFVPDILVTGGTNGGGALEGLAAMAMRFLAADDPLRAASNGGDAENRTGRADLPASTTGKQPPLGGAPLAPPKV